ncbi:proapoptotic nucleolar protein 1 [Castor canadensis]|uniref:Proapoptotic nucleolar protein 1 n=1 Tax=Castor canadensis TaxID=51338 RepID=A0AC58KSK3_CASCN
MVTISRDTQQLKRPRDAPNGGQRGVSWGPRSRFQDISVLYSTVGTQLASLSPDKATEALATYVSTHVPWDSACVPPSLPRQASPPWAPAPDSHPKRTRVRRERARHRRGRARPPTPGRRGSEHPTAQAPPEPSCPGSCHLPRPPWHPWPS